MIKNNEDQYQVYWISDYLPRAQVAEAMFFSTLEPFYSNKNAYENSQANKGQVVDFLHTITPKCRIHHMPEITECVTHTLCPEEHPC